MKDLKQKLDRVFYPRVVGVVGAKRDNDYNWLRTYEPFRARGKVYHINIDQDEWPGAEALGFPNVSSLLDIPEPVDFVTISVPNRVVPTVLRDCVAKGVGGAHIFASGFAELGTEEGQQLENEVRRIGTEAELPIIGPNCLGIYHPQVGLRSDRDFAGAKDGYFSFISQSGTTAGSIDEVAPASGIDVAKGVSFGNGTVLDCTDFLSYFTEDESTEMIGMYLEGVRDGPEFFDVLRRAAGQKPVLVWKVGSTPESAQAGEAHTGSEPVPADLWDAVLKVCGAIKVNSVEDMLDTATALRYGGDVGSRPALIAVSGGHSGKMADVFAHEGFLIPSPTEESVGEIVAFSERIGGSYGNPFEGRGLLEDENLPRTLEVLARDPNFDVIVVEFAAGSIQRNPSATDDRLDALRAYRAKDTGTPVVTVITADMPYAEGANLQDIARQFLGEGIPCFMSMERGARALRNARDYHRRPAWLHGR